MRLTAAAMLKLSVYKSVLEVAKKWQKDYLAILDDMPGHTSEMTKYLF